MQTSTTSFANPQQQFGWYPNVSNLDQTLANPQSNVAFDPNLGFNQQQATSNVAQDMANVPINTGGASTTSTTTTTATATPLAQDLNQPAMGVQTQQLSQMPQAPLSQAPLSQAPLSQAQLSQGQLSQGQLSQAPLSQGQLASSSQFGQASYQYGNAPSSQLAPLSSSYYMQQPASFTTYSSGAPLMSNTSLLIPALGMNNATVVEDKIIEVYYPTTRRRRGLWGKRKAAPLAQPLNAPLSQPLNAPLSSSYGYSPFSSSYGYAPFSSGYGYTPFSSSYGYNYGYAPSTFGWGSAPLATGYASTPARQIAEHSIARVNVV